MATAIKEASKQIYKGKYGKKKFIKQRTNNNLMPSCT
jgi:hypothetical protein